MANLCFARLTPDIDIRSLACTADGTATLLSERAPVCLQHELSHFLAFKKPLYNKVLSIFSNMVLVVPTATTFRKYHQEHHSHLVRPMPLARCHVLAWPSACISSSPASTCSLIADLQIMRVC